MAISVYTQNKIAMIWDFDRTLIPRYSQEPLFAEYGVEDDDFWCETNALPGLYEGRGLKVGKDTAYLGHILSYVRDGTFADLTNDRLLELGAQIECCPGIPDFLGTAQQLVAENPRYQKHEIVLEHYVVSTGIRQLIEGSAVGPFLSGIWASEFIDQPPSPGFDPETHTFDGSKAIAEIGFMMDNTSKTRAIFEINKGPEVDVNARVAAEDRRVPMRNMIYVADGPSDVPVFSLLMKSGGRNLGVYQLGEKSNYAGVKKLQDEGRVNSLAPADFTEDTPAFLWLTTTIREIADAICNHRDYQFAQMTAPAGHVV